jgi:hypothetical protein
MPGRDSRLDQLEDRRYPLHLPLRFRAYRGPTLVKSGEGETLSIGVRDVLFSTPEAPQGGLVAQLSIDWPVLLDGRTPLQLCIFGEIVSCRGEQVLIRIIDHELKLKPTLAKGVGR